MIGVCLKGETPICIERLTTAFKVNVTKIFVEKYV